MLRWSKIRKEDIANGPGMRVSIWVQGCNLHCPGCFNPSTWDPNAGHILGPKVTQQFIELGKPKSIVGYSILGGEPLLNCEEMLQLVRKIKNTYPKKTIWMWTGFTYENLTEAQLEVLKYIDVLVDGPFKQELKNPNLKFKGSTNQRIIDVQSSLEAGHVVLDEIFN